MFKNIVGKATKIHGKDVFCMTDISDDDDDEAVHIVKTFLGTEVVARSETRIFIRRESGGHFSPTIMVANIADIQKETDSEVVLSLGSVIDVNRTAPKKIINEKNLDFFNILDRKIREMES